MQMPCLSTLTARLRDEGGYTLIELVTVMSLLAIVLGTIVTSFTIGIHQEVDQSRREGAYATARLALQRMRLDIHCASGGEDSVEPNNYGGFTLTLTESGDTAGSGWCPAVIPASSGSAGVQWCTIPSTERPGQFRLYRFLGLNPTDCNGGAGSTFAADFIARPATGWPQNALLATTPASWEGNIWPTPPTCVATWLPSVAIDMNVALDAPRHPDQNYELRDVISLRNANRCV
jgi:prepilin-type N-terminal cleavage/methylation domain-containing protein